MAVGTTQQIELQASDDGLPNPPGALTYIITSLPQYGTLSDPSAGSQISSVPYSLVNYGKDVNYTSFICYAGDDNFQFKANDGGTYPYGGDSNVATVSINVQQHMAGAANYTDPEPVVLTVNSSGASGVSITSSTGHGGTTNYTINGSCGTSVNLCAPQYIGSCASRLSFNGWSGSVVSSNLCITFAMNGSETVTANYVSNPQTYTLTVNSSGASGVSISSSTGHGGTTNYTKTVACGASVNLQAPQYVGSCASRMLFTGWTGLVTSSDLSITLTMDTVKTATANFEAYPVVCTLNLYKIGNGSIRVNNALCPLPYSDMVVADTNVTLEAVADSEWQFSHWSGALSGNTNPVTVQVNDNNGVTAHFISTMSPCEFGSFDGKNNANLTLKDCNNNNVTFILKGNGYGEIDCEDCNFSTIALYNTDEKSRFTIKTSSRITTGVGDIIVNGSIKRIAAGTTDLRGDITATGSLGTLTLNDATDEHTITIGSPTVPNPKASVTMVFDQVSDLTIKSEIPIKSFLATEWLGGSINAPSVGSITTKGSKKRGIAGDLDINVTLLNGSINSAKAAGTLSGDWTCNSVKSISAADAFETNLTLNQQPNAKIPALGKLTVKGWMDSSQILSAGNIGTVTSGAMINSNCFAGVAEGVSGLPDPAVDINYVEPAKIKKIAVRGIKGDPNCVINSNIAAAQILNAYLNYPESDNNGIPFGLSAGFIKTLKVKNAQGAKYYKNLDTPKDNQDFGDAKIRLY